MVLSKFRHNTSNYLSINAYLSFSSGTFVLSDSKENKMLLMFPFDVSQRRTYKVIAIYIKGKCH